MRTEECPMCNGSGSHPNGQDQDCPRCKGMGEVEVRLLPIPQLPLKNVRIQLSEERRRM